MASIDPEAEARARLNELDRTCPMAVMPRNHLAEQIKRIIAEAAQRKVKTLDLSSRGTNFKELPSEIGELTSLTSLDLSANYLSSLPPEVGGLTALTSLDLSDNLLSSLPPEVGGLTGDRLPGPVQQPAHLAAAGGRGADRAHLPGPVRQRDHLAAAGGRGADRAHLPGPVRQRDHLAAAGGRGADRAHLPGPVEDRLTSLPPDLGRLASLTKLDLWANDLNALPLSLADLPNLKDLQIKTPEGYRSITNLNNRLTFPPPEVVARGLRGHPGLLRSAREQVPQWSSKLLLVGEGEVGKTTLLKVLLSESGRGIIWVDRAAVVAAEAFLQDPHPVMFREPSTHGIKIGVLGLPRNDDPEQDMTLNAWDFGGQHIYYDTHQFFLTRRSLYLLVWNARMGCIQCDLPRWLDRIRIRTPMRQCSSSPRTSTNMPHPCPRSIWPAGLPTPDSQRSAIAIARALRSYLR